MRITGYEIISFTSLNDTVKFIKEGLSKGWQPYGVLIVNMNPATEDSPELIMYTQAMVEYEYDEEFGNGA